MKNPLFSVALLLLLGIIAGAFIPAGHPPRLVVYLALCGLIASFFVFMRPAVLSSGALLAVVFLAGMIRILSYNDLPANHIRSVAGEQAVPVLVEGKVVTNPVFSRKGMSHPSSQFVLSAEAFQTREGPKSVTGLILVKALAAGRNDLSYGDRVLIPMSLGMPPAKRPDSSFDYRFYLAKKNIYAIGKVRTNMLIERLPGPLHPYTKLRRSLYELKNRCRDFIVLNLEPPHAAILAGMLLGERQYIDDATNDIFLRTGTLHIIAISGLHFTVVIFIFLTLFAFIRLPRRWAYALTMILIFLYGMMVGDVASLWRSVIMASIILMGVLAARRTPIVNVFSCSLIVLLAINPHYIFDAGFVLSYLCVASLIWCVPVTDTWFGVKGSRGIRRFIAGSFSVSASVWLGVFPVIAYYFKTIAPITLLANLIAVPLSFILLGLGMGVLILGIGMPLFALCVFEAIWLVDKVLIEALTLLLKVPGACFPVKDFSLLNMAECYILCAIILVIPHILGRKVKV
ncbi:MAG: ComEC/Rec2 family competence protein [Candidatus Omnitrophica bacterium]|nr:ComEC/Rec2 family competence protein [Candidatus Omnitrophota bacterium]